MTVHDDMSTNARASRGNTALSAWVNEGGDQGDEKLNLTYALIDLMHLADAHGFDWTEIERDAHFHHREEVHDLGQATAVGEADNPFQTMTSEEADAEADYSRAHPPLPEPA